MSCLIGLDGCHTFAAGYDNGLVAIFDRRVCRKTKLAVSEYNVHTDFISGMDIDDSGRHLVTVKPLMHLFSTSTRALRINGLAFFLELLDKWRRDDGGVRLAEGGTRGEVGG